LWCEKFALLSSGAPVFLCFFLCFFADVAPMEHESRPVLVGLGCPILDIKAAVSEEFLATYVYTTQCIYFANLFLCIHLIAAAAGGAWHWGSSASPPTAIAPTHCTHTKPNRIAAVAAFI
jgi:hypothetical protein